VPAHLLHFFSVVFFSIPSVLLPQVFCSECKALAVLLCASPPLQSPPPFVARAFYRVRSVGCLPRGDDSPLPNCLFFSFVTFFFSRGGDGFLLAFSKDFRFQSVLVTALRAPLSCFYLIGVFWNICRSRGLCVFEPSFGRCFLLCGLDPPCSCDFFQSPPGAFSSWLPVGRALFCSTQAPLQVSRPLTLLRNPLIECF